MWQEGIPLAPAVTGRVLLGATGHLTWGVASKCDDVTGAAHAGCVLGADQAMAFLLSLEGDRASRFAPGPEVFSALGPRSCTRCQTRPGQGPTSGPWDDPSRESGPRYR